VTLFAVRNGLLPGASLQLAEEEHGAGPQTQGTSP